MTTSPAVSIWSYEGRASRADYFVVLLVTSILGAIAGSVIVKGGALSFVSGLFFAGVLWVSMCACARRMHDVGHSGWWSLVALVPVANLIFGLYALIAPGQKQDNDYGPAPMPMPTVAPAQSLPDQLTSAPIPLAARAQIHQPTLAPVAARAEVIASISAAPMGAGAEPREEFWAQALHECESTAMKAGLWAKAFADAGGDERMAKATYMRLRAAQLQALYDEEQRALKVAYDLALQAEQEKQKAQEDEVAELLAKMDEAKRAEALLPKGRCPSCDAVIPLASQQCPGCTALFTSDSKWKVKPLSRYRPFSLRGHDH
jgi:uncharacterized membrane protein YhaH (DUF805 family)/rubrerythrin